MSGGGAPRPKALALALIDPFADWTDRAKSSTAERDGVRLHVWYDAGTWLFEVYDPWVSICGGLTWYTRGHAKGCATREAEWLLHQRRLSRPMPRPKDRDEA